MEYFRCESIRLMRFLYSLGFDKKSVIDSKTGNEIWLFEKTDIIKNPELCEQLILEYIKNNGILFNYHSFNYHLDSNSILKLNDKIIIPYQDQISKDYKYLLKTK